MNATMPRPGEFWAGHVVGLVKIIAITARMVTYYEIGHMGSTQYVPPDARVVEINVDDFSEFFCPYRRHYKR